jgi:hypothetical protein
MTDSLTPQRELAQRLLARESVADRGADSTSDRVSAAERAFERLNAHLQKTIGATGFRMLLRRAVERSRSEHPLLASLPSLTDSELPVGELARGAHVGNPEEVEEALVVLLTTFISLLGRFVGDGLAMRLVEESWPERSGGDPTKSGRGVKPNG